MNDADYIDELREQTLGQVLECISDPMEYVDWDRLFEGEAKSACNWLIERLPGAIEAEPIARELRHWAPRLYPEEALAPETLDQATAALGTLWERGELDEPWVSAELFATSPTIRMLAAVFSAAAARVWFSLLATTTDTASGFPMASAAQAARRIVLTPLEGVQMIEERDASVQAALGVLGGIRALLPERKGKIATFLWAVEAPPEKPTQGHRFALYQLARAWTTDELPPDFIDAVLEAIPLSKEPLPMSVEHALGSFELLIQRYDHARTRFERVTKHPAERHSPERSPLFGSRRGLMLIALATGQLAEAQEQLRLLHDLGHDEENARTGDTLLFAELVERGGRAEEAASIRARFTKVIQSQTSQPVASQLLMLVALDGARRGSLLFFAQVLKSTEPSVLSLLHKSLNLAHGFDPWPNRSYSPIEQWRVRVLEVLNAELATRG